MTSAGWVALAITILGAFGYAAASILQAVAARRSAGTVRTLAHPLYLAGLGCDVFAWLAAMVALRELAVYLVESVLATSLAVTVVVARYVLKSPLRRVDVGAVVVSVAALGVLALSAGQQHSVPHSATLRIGFCVAAAAAVLLGWATTRTGSPGLMAVLAGLSLGGASLAGRALHLPPEVMGGPGPIALALVTEPLTAAVLVFAATGMLLYATALQHGQVGPVTAVLWIAEVMVPSAIAVALLGDTVRPGWEPAALIAALVTVGAAVVLATAPAHEATAVPQELPAATARPALAAAAQPITAPPVTAPAVDVCAERVIWWGTPPVWVPPEREPEATPVRAALTWAPGQTWSAVQPADSGPAEAPAETPAAVPAEPPVHWMVALEQHVARVRAESPPPRPWFDQ